MIQELEFKTYLIYSNNFLSRIILQHTGHKGLREKETGDPKNVGGPVLDPFIHHSYSLI